MTEAWASRWFDLLDRFGVVYVLVGGLAGQLHGATRPTRDVDVVPAWHDENLSFLCDALQAIDARSTTGPEVSGEGITPALLAEHEVMTWQTALGRIDTLVGIPDSEGLPVDFAALDRRAVVVDVAGYPVRVASLDDVITSKEFASRAKDRLALSELRRLRDSQPPSSDSPSS